LLRLAVPGSIDAGMEQQAFLKMEGFQEADCTGMDVTTGRVTLLV